MFERYTEKARRVIFFGRYEASQFGSSFIETEHLLLGILREDKALTNRFLRSHATVDSIRKQIEQNTTLREKVSTSVDLPLSDEAKRVLAFAAEEADRMSSKQIGTEHLFLGLLRESGCLAAKILEERGIKLDAAREQIAKTVEARTPESVAEAVGSAGGMFRNLTQAAVDGLLSPVVGRDLELDRVIEILANRGRRNAILIGPRGAGKTAIVEGLAQRISEGVVPDHLANKKIFTVPLQLLTGWPTDCRRFDEFTKLLGTGSLDHVILFIEDFDQLLHPSVPVRSTDQGRFLHWLLSNAGVQCIGKAEAAGLNEPGIEKSWLAECFREVHVRPLDAKGTMEVLRARKVELEKFHEVAFSDEAVESAARSASRSSSHESSIVRAIELLDSAGAMVKLRRGAMPDEVRDLRKRIAFITHRRESALANHEFEKARFYEDEERKEHEGLQALESRLGMKGSEFETVTAEDIEKVLAQWSEYPYSQ